MSNIFNWN